MFTHQPKPIIKKTKKQKQKEQTKPIQHKQKTKQGNLYHLDKNNNTIIAITETITPTYKNIHTNSA
jgi:hypothetical protein